MKIIFIALVLFSQTVLANSWVSSGGEIFKDAKNPWWLKNKGTISYCIAIDEKSVSATPADIKLAVNKVFSNWITEFGIFSKNGRNLFSLGDNNLIETSCSGSEDIAFKFGWDSLSSEQKQYLMQTRDFKSIIGTTVRTEYDFKKLSGKGFVYIASDLGQFAFNTSPNLYKKPWRHNFLLSVVLAHEIAHTFGIGHSDLFSGMMKDDFFETFLDADFVESFEESLSTIWNFNFFSRQKNHSLFISDDQTELSAFFGVPAKSKLFLVKTSDFSFEIHSNFNGVLTRTHKIFSKFGTFKMGNDNKKISLFITSDQTLFPLKNKESDRLIAYTDTESDHDIEIENIGSGIKVPANLSGDAEKMTLRFFDGKTRINAEFESNLINFASKKNLKTKTSNSR